DEALRRCSIGAALPGLVAATGERSRAPVAAGPTGSGFASGRVLGVRPLLIKRQAWVAPRLRPISLWLYARPGLPSGDCEGPSVSRRPEQARRNASRSALFLATTTPAVFESRWTSAQ